MVHLWVPYSTLEVPTLGSVPSSEFWAHGIMGDLPLRAAAGIQEPREGLPLRLCPYLGMLLWGHPHPPPVTAQQPNPATSGKTQEKLAEQPVPKPCSSCSFRGGVHLQACFPGSNPDLPLAVWPQCSPRQTGGLASFGGIRTLRAHISEGLSIYSWCSVIAVSTTPSQLTFPCRQPLGCLEGVLGQSGHRPTPGLPKRGKGHQARACIPTSADPPLPELNLARKYSQVMLTS